MSVVFLQIALLTSLKSYAVSPDGDSFAQYGDNAQQR